MIRQEKPRTSVRSRASDSVRKRKRLVFGAFIACIALVASAFNVAAASVEASDVDAPAAALGSPAPGDALSSQAQQEGAELECPDAATLHFEPGLTATPEEQRITGNLVAGTELSPTTPCTSATGVPYQGAVGEIEGSGVLGCAGAGAVEEIGGTIDVTWDNGDKSLVRWKATTYGAAPVVTAEFVEGPLKGATVIQEAVPTGVSGNCTESPLKGGGFAGVVEVVRP